MPHWALIAGGIFGVLCVFSDNLIVLNDRPLTANVITLACFGSITMYIVSIFSLFKLRRSAPDMKRPFKAVFYPVFPIFALIGSLVCLVAMVVYNPEVFIVYLVLMALGYVYFLCHKRKIRETAQD